MTMHAQVTPNDVAETGAPLRLVFIVYIPGKEIFVHVEIFVAAKETPANNKSTNTEMGMMVGRMRLKTEITFKTVLRQS